MHFHILTIFPEILVSPLSASLLKKAQERGTLRVSVHNLRDYATGKHRSTDDSPYGGGPGMVMKPEPIVAALEAISLSLSHPWRVLLSPQGIPLTQAKVGELAKKEDLILICGRYEGVDERVQTFIDEEISIGDYILSGGEVAALVVIDVVARLVPGFVGKRESVQEESFTSGLLEYPQYTRPEEFRGLRVPEVLLSGHHQEVARWRQRQALLRTKVRRPDLLARLQLTKEDQALLQEDRES